MSFENTNIWMLVASSRRVSRQLIAAKSSQIGLTPDLFWMLLVIDRAEATSLGKLAEAMRFDNPTMSRMVHDMSQRGYLHIGADPSHGRRVSISLTTKGHGLCAGLADMEEAFSVKALEGFTGEEEIALHTLLGRYLENLDAVAAKELPGVSLRTPKAA